MFDQAPVIDVRKEIAEQGARDDAGEARLIRYATLRHPPFELEERATAAKLVSCAMAMIRARNIPRVILSTRVLAIQGEDIDVTPQY